jgi:magnesium chelatase family protein
LDRIDIFIDVPDIKVADLAQNKDEIEKSSSIKSRVIKAREIQSERYKGSSILTNSEANGHELEKYLMDSSKDILYKCVDKAKISARGYYRIVKLARTLADIEGADSLETSYVSEALSYRRIM